MNKKLIYNILIMMLITLVSSCQYDFYEADIPPVDPNVDVSFSIEIVPIFAGKCLNCHGGSIAPDLRAENAYASIVPSRVNTEVPNDSKIYTKALPSGSHSAKYSDAEAALILLWIEQGAQNN